MTSRTAFLGFWFAFSKQTCVFLLDLLPSNCEGENADQTFKNEIRFYGDGLEI